MRTLICAALVALVASAASRTATPAPAGKPVLAVLPITSAGDRGRMGRFVRNALNKKLERTFQYVMIFPQEVDDVLAAEGFRLRPTTSPAQVDAFATNALQCRFVLWGRVVAAGGGWNISIKGMDLSRSKTGLTWQINETAADLHGVPLACGRIAAEVSGFEKRIGREPGVPEAKRRKAPRKALLSNGDFEAGSDTPAHWQRVDNLTTFWEKKSKNGRGLLVDTDVLESQALAWRGRLAKGADFRRPPEKEPTRPPKYDTIGGTYGVHFISDPMPVKRGVVYRLSADVKGRTTDFFFPKIFVKGCAPFAATQFEGQDREIYRMYLACRSETGGREFEHHTRTFLPNAHYMVFELENTAGTPHAAKAADLLRQHMRERNFPQIPLEEQKRRLVKSPSHIGFDTVMPEIILTIRDKLLCAHGIYGKVERTDKGLQLCLRLASARIKRNIPLLDLAYLITDDNSLSAACEGFLSACEKRLPFVATMRVIPYSYWPPGPFRYDNIILTEEGDTLW